MSDDTLYSLLPHRRAIRLLRIKTGTGEEDIQITLETFDLDSKTQFTALSYVWGDATSPCEIICNGHTKSITRNLWGVLSQLQKQWFNCLLWVDAICINQEDKEEKSFQVAMMRDIYRRAAKVIFWLGQQERYDEEAINLMRSFSKRITWTGSILQPSQLQVERNNLHRVSRFLACKFRSPGSSDLPSWVPDWKPIGFNFVPLTRYYTGTATFTRSYHHATVKDKLCRFFHPQLRTSALKDFAVQWHLVLPHVGLLDKNSEVDRLDRHSLDWPCEGIPRSDYPWFYICSVAAVRQLYMRKTGNDAPPQSFVKYQYHAISIGCSHEARSSSKTRRMRSSHHCFAVSIADRKAIRVLRKLRILELDQNFGGHYMTARDQVDLGRIALTVFEAAGAAVDEQALISRVPWNMP
ncbi:heterokaryon incompatibility [Stemphylium lycopersici]|uniref:Heterokaryon incompatibility n=1 Tax=Stemphylium lycopersici TaxID=183478 RepID=A0A364N9H7_STELY|nr:heterokaryon incompatibility [Stemphylium lycopersici]RAR13959.1 heterokaryon incompatibility [Stemphylium lycopersici]